LPTTKINALEQTKIVKEQVSNEINKNYKTIQKKLPDSGQS